MAQRSFFGKQSGPRSGLLAWLLCGAMAAAGPVWAEPQTLYRHQINAVSTSEQQERLAQLLASASQHVGAQHLQSEPPAGRATASLRTLFSAQAGSWPFESFARNGLFKTIARYQAHHPRALVISGGSITLAQLHQTMADERILRKHKDGYLLSYPLLIAADAALLVENTSLYLYTQSGTALINQGMLSLKQATLESWSGDKSSADGRPFRPFIMAWAGSSTQIESSTVTKLGYNAHLARGLTTARSSEQPAHTGPARVLLRESLIDGLSTGLELQHAFAVVENSRLQNLQQYAIDVQDSRVSISHNRIDKVRNNSGIRIRGNSEGLVEHNVILHIGKAAIEVAKQSGNLALTHNMIGSVRNGILLRDISGPDENILLLAKNLIANSSASGIDGANVKQVYIADNRVSLSPEYAISMRNPPQPPSRLIVVENKLGQMGKAMIRVEGVTSLILGGNLYQSMPNNQPILSGDLLPVQSLLMEATLVNGCFVEVLMAPHAAPQNQPAPPTCDPDGQAEEIMF